MSLESEPRLTLETSFQARKRTFEMLGPLNQDDTNRMHKDALIPYIDNALNLMEADSQNIVEDLNSQNDYYKERHLNLSRPRIIAKYIDATTYGFLEDYSRIQRPEDLLVFPMFFDFYVGAVHILSSIKSAEDSLSGNLDHNLAERLDELTVEPTMNAEIFIQLRESASEARALLLADSTGKLLIKTAVLNLTENPSILPEFVNPTFALEGARFVEKAYELIYHF